MPSKDSGYFNKLVRKLTSDVEELDADELSQRAQAGGAQRACDCKQGESVTVLGRIRSVELCPDTDTATLKAELFDGTDEVTLVWLGRRKIPGIDAGRTIKVSGRIGERDGQKVLYNPYYELQTVA